MTEQEQITKSFADLTSYRRGMKNRKIANDIFILLAALEAAIRQECAERALVFYCQEVCIEDGEKENAICRRRGGCKWANQLRAAIIAEPPKDEL